MVRNIVNTAKDIIKWNWRKAKTFLQPVFTDEFQEERYSRFFYMRSKIKKVWQQTGN